MQKNTGICPNCEAEIAFKKPPSRGQVIECRHCGSRLEVVHRNPISLDWADEDPFEYAEPRSNRGEKRTRRRVSESFDW